MSAAESAEQESPSEMLDSAAAKPAEEALGPEGTVPSPALASRLGPLPETSPALIPAQIPKRPVRAFLAQVARAIGAFLSKRFFAMASKAILHVWCAFRQRILLRLAMVIVLTAGLFAAYAALVGGQKLNPVYVTAFLLVSDNSTTPTESGIRLAQDHRACLAEFARQLEISPARLRPGWQLAHLVSCQFAGVVTGAGQAEIQTTIGTWWGVINDAITVQWRYQPQAWWWRIACLGSLTLGAAAVAAWRAERRRPVILFSVLLLAAWLVCLLYVLEAGKSLVSLLESDGTVIALDLSALADAPDSLLNSVRWLLFFPVGLGLVFALCACVVLIDAQAVNDLCRTVVINLPSQRDLLGNPPQPPVHWPERATQIVLCRDEKNAAQPPLLCIWDAANIACKAYRFDGSATLLPVAPLWQPGLPTELDGVDEQEVLLPVSDGRGVFVVEAAFRSPKAPGAGSSGRDSGYMTELRMSKWNPGEATVQTWTGTILEGHFDLGFPSPLDAQGRSGPRHLAGVTTHPPSQPVIYLLARQIRGKNDSGPSVPIHYLLKVDLQNPANPLMITANSLGNSLHEQSSFHLLFSNHCKLFMVERTDTGDIGLGCLDDFVQKSQKSPAKRSPESGGSVPQARTSSGDYQGGWRSRFRRDLAHNFSKQELETLCSDLGLEYDAQSGSTRAIAAREIIGEAERKGKIPELDEWCRRERPRVQWVAPPAMRTNVASFVAQLPDAGVSEVPQPEDEGAENVRIEEHFSEVQNAARAVMVDDRLYVLHWNESYDMAHPSTRWQIDTFRFMSQTSTWRRTRRVTVPRKAAEMIRPWSLTAIDGDRHLYFLADDGKRIVRLRMRTRGVIFPRLYVE